MSEELVHQSRKGMWQALAVVVLSMIPGLIVPSAKPLAYAVPLVYLLIEKRRMGRSWEEIGIRARTFGRDLRHNWHLFLLVALVLQAPVALLAWARWPALLQHVRSRVPFLTPSSFGALLLTIVLVAFLEELIFRGFLQQRLAWFLRAGVAILIASLLFALQHFTPTSPAIVAVDLGGVFLDSLVYGWIFARCRNVLVSWSAHVAADLIGVTLILLLPR